MPGFKLVSLKDLKPMKFILGLKEGMSQIFEGDEGHVVPVTVIEAGPCRVLQVKTKDRDGYEAVQVGFKKLKEKAVKKPQKDKPFRYIREFSVRIKEKSKDGEEPAVYKVGQNIDVSVFEKGDKVKVAGTSKGKGFQGGVKRWGFAGRPTTRGTKHEVRGIGSIGGSIPAKVLKGKKMPGRMGGERKTIKNLEVVSVDKDNNLLVLKGAVPGKRGSLLEISVSKYK
jgi:large subunit ribosomal protein L3